MSVSTIDEEGFFLQVREFLRTTYGPDCAPADLDQDLVHEVGLTSLQLIELLGFLEQLRGKELEEVPELSGLSLRTLHRELYLG